MMTGPRRKFLITVTALCMLSACVGKRMTPYVEVGDRTLKVDELRALAEQGGAEDQYNLGVRYETAHFVPQDYKEAARWYRAAALQRHPEALYKMCEMSDLGRGLLQDYQEALRWCRLAADQGHAHAMFVLGVHYHTARGVTKDVLEAHKWYNLATAHGYDGAVKWRDRLTLDMTPVQITQAQLLARDWKPRLPERHEEPPAEKGRCRNGGSPETGTSETCENAVTQ